ncbi:MAG: ribonuclease P [Parcubacteria group bacterium ADurb.Bin326]|nr:MAG: ribonuclease P [Parcubacteria group bacterium ADurb.Bin326]
MIAQKNRLSKKADFERIFKSSNKDFGQCFTIRFLENGLNYCRFSVVISNRFSKKATERNRYRRQIKAVLLDNLSNFRENIDLIITVLPTIKKLDFAGIKAELEKQLKSKKVIK